MAFGLMTLWMTTLNANAKWCLCQGSQLSSIETRPYLLLVNTCGWEYLYIQHNNIQSLCQMYILCSGSQLSSIETSPHQVTGKYILEFEYQDIWHKNSRCLCWVSFMQWVTMKFHRNLTLKSNRWNILELEYQDMKHNNTRSLCWVSFLQQISIKFQRNITLPSNGWNILEFEYQDIQHSNSPC